MTNPALPSAQAAACSPSRGTAAAHTQRTACSIMKLGRRAPMGPSPFAGSARPCRSRDRRLSARRTDQRLQCTAAQASRAKGAPKTDTILVLGGNGFVGRAVAKAAGMAGYSVVSVSRRGPPEDVEGEEWAARVRWLKADLVKDQAAVGKMLAELKQETNVVGVIHAVGMLLESPANALASGSGSTPANGVTYDEVTRKTALAAAEAWVDCTKGSPEPPPFVFVSAAEAGWTDTLGGDPFFTPDFLVRYLKAKRDVEAALMAYASQGLLRPVIMRPSLVFTPEKLPSLPAVAGFFAANALGVPGVDRPVLVDTLARAAVVSIKDKSSVGVKDFKAMEELAEKKWML